ncbi:hypothetical protein M3Y97_00749100 [Aphelenchoides bicaudatus]|nr:hypothetical protein M3Y97_00749100 [Aphelenchoides bicaudatus]
MTILANVEEVDLRKNLITIWSQIDQLLYDKKRLKSLNLADNFLEHLFDEQFAQFSSLQTLRLARNRIKSIELSSFENLGQLQNLDLSRNLLTVLPTLLFGSLSALKRLNLARNHLINIQAGCFHGADSLVHLNLSSNRLDFSLIDGGLYGLKALEELDLTNNKLDKLPTQLYNYAPNLKRLWLKANKMSKLSGSKFTLPDLEFLSLASNGLESIQPGLFNGLFSLTEIDLSDNKLANIIEDKSSLRNLSLSRLRRLDFAANNVKALRAGAFSEFSKLEYLDLRRNPISTMEVGSFNGVSLTRLFMDSQSLHCDCNLKWFIEWVHASKIDSENLQLICRTPTKLRGQRLLSLSTDKLVCGAESPLVRSILHPPSLAKKLVGTTASFKCSGYGLAPLKLEWKLFKDGNNVKLESKKNKFSLFVNNTKNKDGSEIEHIYGELDILNLEMRDSGDYQCSIQNAHNTVYLDPVQLVVQQKPVFKLKPKDVVAMQGTNVLLECAADGNPAPIIVWDKDRRQEFPAAVERRLHLRESEDGVYLLNVSKIDEGLYTCHATSDAGHISHSAYVKVFDDVFKNRLDSTAIQSQTEASFNCASKLDSSFELKWLWNEKIPINESGLKFSIDKQTLTLHWTENLKDGVISCELYVNGQLLSHQSADITIGVDSKKARNASEYASESTVVQTTPKRRQLSSNWTLIVFGLILGMLLSISIISAVCLVKFFYTKNRKDELSSNGSKQPLNKDTL